MPDACAKGILATNAISKVPITAPNAVARNIDDHSVAAALELKIALGLTTSMYAIAKNVTIPATISVPIVLPALLMPKKLSSFLPKVFFSVPLGACSGCCSGASAG